MKLTINIESDNIGVSNDYEVAEIVKRSQSGSWKVELAENSPIVMEITSVNGSTNATTKTTKTKTTKTKATKIKQFSC